MKARTFFAATSRDALRQVKAELGPDAVILSNRRVDDGIEIVALATDDPPPREVRPPAAPAPATASPPQQANTEFVQSVMSEIRTLRTLVEEQLAGLSWNDAERRDPARMQLLRIMLNAGFSPALSRRMIGRLPPGKDVEQGLKWVQAAIALNVRTPTEAANIVDEGGIYARVGPTGVGKTTTVAKIASRFVVKHGADKLALLTTDTYRIGGHEQLRIYGRLLGVPVHAVKDPDDLRVTLSELRNKRLVLIDTVGMGQRDRLVAEQDALLEASGAPVKRVLLLNATCNGSTLDDVATAFRAELASGCIITKVDEAASLGVPLDAVLRRGLMLHYIANGQKVPEDLHVANAQYLVRTAFRIQAQTSPFSLADGELPLVAAGLARTAGGSDTGPAPQQGARCA